MFIALPRIPEGQTRDVSTRGFVRAIAQKEEDGSDAVQQVRSECKEKGRQQCRYAGIRLMPRIHSRVAEDVVRTRVQGPF